MKKTLLVVGLILLLMLQYRFWFGETGVNASRALQQRLSATIEDNDVQQHLNDQLVIEVEDLRSGNTILEEKAREDLGLVRKGETFIIFSDKSRQP